nr:MAG TPA: hypothetical protein [Caudoviricetes sp.]
MVRLITHNEIQPSFILIGLSHSYAAKDCTILASSSLCFLCD